MNVGRTMLSFAANGCRFNHRVAGIAIRNAHVLVCREDDDGFVLLPGGRIEFGEDSATALKREIAEELQYPAAIGRQLFTAEDFFIRRDEQFHELGIYYAIDLSPEFPFVTGKTCLTTPDEGHELHFTWVPIEDAALTTINLLPQWLRRRLKDLPVTPEHVVHRVP